MNQDKHLTGLGKRRKIQSANRMMFLWVAAASAIVSFALVALQFVYQQFAFNNRVLQAKNSAMYTLNTNIKSIASLKDEINKLQGNADLAKLRNNDNENPQQVVIDALPANSDVTGLAVSLQKLIVPRSAVSLESVSVPNDAPPATGIIDVQPVAQIYGVEVVGSYDAVKVFLQNLERTIRPIHIKSLQLTGSDTMLKAQISLATYYQPTKTVTIKKEVQH
ncbi:MAG: hypothetical protein WBB39_04655 [Candidatus Saccharimonadales bacterium]